MKILCLSDTHLENSVFDAINKRYPDMDMYIHCGDSSLSITDPLLQGYYVVRGNHDETTFPMEIKVKIEAYQCLIVHGNHHDVYQGYHTILSYMEKEAIDICLHGHTHIPSAITIQNKYIINPGSVMINRASYGYGTYAIITIATNKIEVTYYHHTTHQECTEEVLADGITTLQKIRQCI